MNPRIRDPNSIEAANYSAKMGKGIFQMKVNKMTPEELWKELQELPDLIKAKLESASKENPERQKRELRKIRHKLLLWYNLEEVEDIGCWQGLLDIREELKWYIDETERLYYSLSQTENISKVEVENNVTQPSIEENLQSFQHTTANNENKILVKPAAIAAFATLIKGVGIMQRMDDESATDFCKKVCNAYNIVDNPNARKSLDRKISKTILAIVKDRILPTLTEETQVRITKHLNTNK